MWHQLFSFPGKLQTKDRYQSHLFILPVEMLIRTICSIYTFDTLVKDDFTVRTAHVQGLFCFEFVDVLHFGNSVHEVF